MRRAASLGRAEGRVPAAAGAAVPVVPRVFADPPKHGGVAAVALAIRPAVRLRAVSGTKARRVGAIAEFAAAVGYVAPESARPFRQTARLRSQAVPPRAAVWAVPRLCLG